jgi:hypothetical protein
MLLWIYIYSAYVECNFGWFAYFIFCRRKQFKRKKKKIPSLNGDRCYICWALRELERMRFLKSNVPGMKVGGRRLTGAEDRASTLMPMARHLPPRPQAGS